MKKYLKNIGVFALCLALLLGVLWCIPGNVSTAKAAASTNLLADYDFSFENTAVGSDPANWKGYDSSENHYAVTDEEASHGTHSLKFEIRENTTASRGVYTPYVNVESLSSVFVSVDFKSEHRTNFYIYFYDENNAAVGSTITDFRIPDGTWTTFTKTFDVPTGAKTMRMMIYKAATPVHVTYIDNVIIRDATYYEINENFDSLLVADALFGAGWKSFNGSSNDCFALETEASGKSLEITCINSNVSTGLYSPYITLGDATKIRVSADVKMTGSGQVYLYFYKADKQTNADSTNRILYGVNNGEWTTKTEEWDVPEGAVYARLMLYVGKSATPTYFDNIVVAPVTQTTTTTAPATTAPATTAPATTAPATTAPATTAPATTAPATTAPAVTTAPAGTTVPATTAPAESPDTGDTSALILMIMLMTLSVVALVATKAKFGTR